MTYVLNVTETPQYLSVQISGKTQNDDLPKLIEVITPACLNYVGNRLLMDFRELDGLDQVVYVCKTLYASSSIRERRVKLAVLTSEKEIERHAQHSSTLSDFGKGAALFADLEQALAWLQTELPALPPVAKDVDAALAFLQTYGVEHLLTHQDDPRLWAAALLRHWLEAYAPKHPVDSLRFGICAISTDEATSRIRLDFSPEIWCFERSDAQHLRLVPCSPTSTPTMGNMMAMMAGLQSGESVPSMQVSMTAYYLELPRPSVGQERVPVRARWAGFPNVGDGEARYWELVDGEWRETKDVAERWMV